MWRQEATVFWRLRPIKNDGALAFYMKNGKFPLEWL